MTRKNTLIISILSLSLLLTACSGSVTDGKPNLNKAYTFNVSFLDDDVKYTASAVRSGVNNWSVQITEPSALDNLIISLDESGMKFTCGAFDVNIPESTTTSVKSIINALESAFLDDTAKTKSSGEKLLISGEDYTMELLKSDASLLTLNIPSERITCEFSDVKISKLADSDFIEE